MLPKSPAPKKTANPMPQVPASAARFPVIPEHVRPLLGPSWLVEGEDPKLYEDLLARVGAAVNPLDIIDWLLVKDVVALTWETQRTRRQRDTVVRMGRLKSMIKILDAAFPRSGGVAGLGRDGEIIKLASDWLRGDKKATKEVEGLINQAGFSMADLAPQILTDKAVELDRIDQQTQRHEDRRDKILQQIERRRAGWSRSVKRASEDVVDAEFREASPEIDGNGSDAEFEP